MSIVEKAERGAIQATLSFDDRLYGATVIDSASLEDKLPLLGVPMLITRVTYRPKGAMQERGYVSVEAIIADAKRIGDAIRRGWIPNVQDMSDFPYEPEEKIVFNDGSTGIRRQLTAILHIQEYLNIGAYEPHAGQGVDPAFDRDWSNWQSFSDTTTQKVGGDVIDIPDFELVPGIFARRGLRVSQYDMDGTAAETFYLA